jgi:hypothetical protein
MTDMLRKQIYISRRQHALLKRLAKERGASESEIIRRAIDQEAGKVVPRIGETTRRQAWDEAYAFMLSIRAQGPIENRPRQWQRDDLYAERLNRYEQNPD